MMAIDIIRQHDEACEALNTSIRNLSQRQHARKLAKSTPVSEEEFGEALQQRIDEERAAREPRPEDFSRNADGVRARGSHPWMCALLLREPRRYEQLMMQCIASLPTGAVTPQELNVLVSQVQAAAAAVAVMPAEQRSDMTKAFTRQQAAMPSPALHGFEKTLGGVQAAIDSPQGQELRRRDPGAFAKAILDLASNVPGIGPREIGALRMRLNQPDGATMTKAVHNFSDSLTAGQKVICGNFGPDFDPNNWMQCHR